MKDKILNLFNKSASFKVYEVLILLTFGMVMGYLFSYVIRSDI